MTYLHTGRKRTIAPTDVDSCPARAKGMNNRELERVEGWVRKIHKETPIAVILGGSVNGLSLARSLGRRRIPTLLLDSDRLIGTYTRYSKFVLQPPADKHP